LEQEESSRQKSREEKCEERWGWEIQRFRPSPKGKKKPVSVPVAYCRHFTNLLPRDVMHNFCDVTLYNHVFFFLLDIAYDCTANVPLKAA